MNPDSRIYVAGHRGLAGSALVRALLQRGFGEIITRTHAELDLVDHHAVQEFFARERPQIVLLAAAKVGGIHANDTYPADFIYENLAIQTNVIHEAWRSGVQRLLFLGSSCIYPRDCPQPIREEYVLTGPLEPTNRAYAMAKLAGLEMCWSYNRQHGTRFICAMPTNLYGPGDNYDLQTSHVLPALIHRFHLAKVNGQEFVTLWGTGTPRREFLYSDDMASACIRLLECSDAQLDEVLPSSHSPLVNVGFGRDCTISELAELIRDVVGSQVEIRWDAKMPDGTPRKLLDIGRIERLEWKAVVGLREGIGRAYADMLAVPGDEQ